MHGSVESAHTNRTGLCECWFSENFLDERPQNRGATKTLVNGASALVVCVVYKMSEGSVAAGLEDWIWCLVHWLMTNEDVHLLSECFHWTLESLLHFGF